MRIFIFIIALGLCGNLQAQIIPVLPAKKEAKPAEKPKPKPKKAAVKTKIVYVEKPDNQRTTNTSNYKFPQMVYIPYGSFNMGNESGAVNQKPMHKVSISGFNMGKYEVTVGEFKSFIDDTKYRTDAEIRGFSYIFNDKDNKWEKSNGLTWRDDEEGRRRLENDFNKPVIYVSWTDAVAYCKWLTRITGKTYRLPTEAEWEYTAGNGAKHTKYSWGNFEPGSNDRVGNVADESIKSGYISTIKFVGYTDGYFFAAPVGTFWGNDFGLHDMSGNVWEWCSDWYDEKYYINSPNSNPTGASTGSYRSLRGGSWNYGSYNNQVVHRWFNIPNDGFNIFGFRVASSL